MFRAFHRERDEETGDVGDVFQSRRVGFFHENRGALLDELVVFRALGVELFEFVRILADGGHRFHRGAVAIRPASAAAVLIDIHKFLRDALILRDANERAHALPVEREAFGERVRNEDEDIFRQIFKFLEETAARLLFAAVVEIGDIGDENDVFVLSFDDFRTEFGDRAPFVVRHAIAGRIIGDAVQNDDGIVLFRDHIGNVFLEAVQIEMAVVRQEGKRARLASGVNHDAVVSAPMPIGHEDFIARRGIIVHGMVEPAGAARCGNGANETGRTGFAKALGQDRFQIVGIALNRRVRGNLTRRQAFVRALNDFEHDKVAVFVQNGADGPIDDIFFPNLVGQSGRTVVRGKNIVLGTLPLRLHGGYTIAHVSSSL